MSERCQKSIQGCFERLFEKWGDLVSKRTTIVFIASLVFFVALGTGMAQSKPYEDEQLVWTPQGNPSITNYEKQKELFKNDEKARPIQVIAESKSDNLLTLGAFREMIQFNQMLHSISEPRDTTRDEDGEVTKGSKDPVTFDQICRQQQFMNPNNAGGRISKCFGSDQLIDFVAQLDYEGFYNLEPYENDAQLIQRIQEGTSVLSKKDYVALDNFLSVTFPEEVTQNTITGANNIEKAKATQFSFLIENGRNPDIDESFYEVWEKKLIEALADLNAETEFIQFELLTIRGLEDAFVEDIQADLASIQIAIVLVALYTILVLGTLSAIHCRLVVSLMGLLCVGFAYASGFGLMFYCGGETAGVHNLMPFLLIGIGCDDMFVICNAIDQTDLKAPAQERIRQAIKHAGPSITITSLTNVLAFAFGGLASLLALRSFCLFASVCIIMLYLSVMTVFLCVVVWDTERVGRKKGECCGLFCCKQDSIICCRGYFLSPKMIRYGSVPDAETDAAKKVERNDEINRDNETASMTEKCLDKYLAPYLLSNPGRIIVLIVYLVLIAGSIYGITQVEIDFKVTFFIGETADVYDFYQLNDKYFSQGFATTTYVDNDQLDYSSEEVQTQLQTYYQNLEACTGCSENWFMPNTLDSWYDSFLKWTKAGGCAPTTPGSSSDSYFVPEDVFYPCLNQFLRSPAGGIYRKDIITVDATENDVGRIVAFRQTIMKIQIEEVAKQGVQFLSDLRAIQDAYALEGTYSYSQDMLDYELYVVFKEETALSVGLSLIAVFFVVLFVTGSLPVTFLVVLAVLLVDLFLIALVHYWDLTFNTVVVIQVVIAIGLAVDYSAHIAHTYLIIEPPEGTTRKEQRLYKAWKALSKMGSSVFHGGFSTFLAIIVLGSAQSYIFVVFFRMWFGIIVFGMSNGFLLLPVILSYVGPLQEPKVAGAKVDANQKGKKEETDLEKRQKKIKDAEETPAKANMVA